MLFHLIRADLRLLRSGRFELRYRLLRFQFIDTTSSKGVRRTQFTLMRKSISKLLLAGVVALTMAAMTSCGFSREATSNNNLVQTEVILQKANYKVIGTISATSSQTYILGFGGLSKKSLGQSAMSDLYKQADMLGKSRAVINVNVSYKNAYYTPLVIKSKAIATGTVIEFTE